MKAISQSRNQIPVLADDPDAIREGFVGLLRENRSEIERLLNRR